MDADVWTLSTTPAWADHRNAAGFAAVVLNAVAAEIQLLTDAPTSENVLLGAATQLVGILRRLSTQPQATIASLVVKYDTELQDVRRCLEKTRDYAGTKQILVLRIALHHTLIVGENTLDACVYNKAQLTQVPTNTLIRLFLTYPIFSNIDAARVCEMEIPWRLRDAAERQPLPPDYVAAFEAAWAVGEKLFAYKMVQER